MLTCGDHVFNFFEMFFQNLIYLAIALILKGI